MHRFLLLLFLWVFSVDCLAQAPVSGLTLDAETAEPLPYANIVILGRQKGAVSNSEGYFVLDARNMTPGDTVIFSYLGYESLKISFGDLRNKSNIYLKPAPINLKEVQVLSGTLTAEEIIQRVRENYQRNYPAPDQKRRVFYHKYEKTLLPQTNQIEVKKSDLAGMDKKAVEEFLSLLPNQFTEYQDAIVDLYNHGEMRKLKPIEAVSLEEGSMEAIGKEMEERLTGLLDDIEKSRGNEDIFYKFRTGIFAMKVNPSGNTDSVWIKQRADSLNYILPVKLVKEEIAAIIADYTTPEGKHWEFINKPHRYNYVLEEPTVLNDELVYKITFSSAKNARNKGLYEGEMYISTDTYAILQLDFAFAEGKSADNIQLMGFGHSTRFRGARVIFEKFAGAYHLKYVSTRHRETASIERQFSILKKRRRTLFNKTLGEVKLDLRLFFDMTGEREILILNREEIGSTQFQRIDEPATMKFRKKYAYTQEMWDNGTVVAPGPELKKYKRK